MKENSSPAHIVRWVNKNASLLKSTDTEDELLQVMSRPQIARLLSPRFVEYLREMMASAELVHILEEINVCRDKKDNKFIELSVNGRADAIISGDQDLLALNPFRGVPILSAADFLHFHDARQ
ncbi:MAG: putative toxin-antitoxin system toxin component, PIN family [Magnetococcales bacterium]|nr:putative toxin-antitoxin system toxin component, PIN family [Magnetococcales bacterium]